ncbi:MAG: IMPACT family protein [Fidelibacterota bacterium]
MPYRIKKPSEVVHKVKGSKFIARVYPVTSREEARKVVMDAEVEHRKATHVCWACRIVRNGECFGYSSDAGEPTGSAGPPILAEIEMRDLVNVLCVVIRYFGGTKLGIGGLIRAYGTAAAEALRTAGRQRHVPLLTVTIRCDPGQYSDLMRIIRKYRLPVQPEYDIRSVVITLKLPAAVLERLQAEVVALESATLMVISEDATE